VRILRCNHRPAAWLATALSAATAFAILVLPAVALASPSDQTADLYATLQSMPDTGTFVRLLDQAKLTDMLRGSSLLTVWAPTDSAFTKLSPGVLNRLTAQPTVLREILSYHLAPDPITAAQIVQLPTVKTVQGESTRITSSGGAVHINDATVVRADVMASNGLIHVIDGVLVPPSRVGSLPSTGNIPSPVPLVVGLGTLLVAAGVGLRLRTEVSRTS
jgi:LPXTG-motif cell wall-anchored protein